MLLDGGVLLVSEGDQVALNFFLEGSVVVQGEVNVDP